MRELFIDIETFSPVNLANSGVYPYADHDGFELLLFGYSIDGGPVEVVDLANGHQLPEKVLSALVDPLVVKWAFNATFERICLSSWLARQYPELMAGRRFLNPAQWRCTMVWSAYLGLPMSLDQVATVLHLPVRKDSTRAHGTGESELTDPAQGLARRSRRALAVTDERRSRRRARHRYRPGA